ALQHLKIYLIGSFAMAFIASFLFGFIGYVTLFLLEKKKMVVDNG
ncbi:MAG: DUF2062 domain-containing protein, partial [Pricia sp.]|nr:DUF2062 domain-containing protein [Pricia sp.]